MLRLSPISTPTDTLIPYTTLFRSPRMMKQVVQRDASVRRSTRSGRVKEYFYGNPLADRQFAPSRLALFFHDVALFRVPRSEEHTSELQSLMRISYAVFCLKKKKEITQYQQETPTIYSQPTKN